MEETMLMEFSNTSLPRRVSRQSRPSMSEWLLHILHESGAQTLDQVGTLIPSANWAQLFLAVDKLTREGAIELRFAGHGEYVLTPRARNA